MPSSSECLARGRVTGFAERRAAAWFLCLVGIAPLCGCGGGGGATEEPRWGSLVERPCPEESTLTYDNFGGPFLLTWCTSCHGSALEGARDRQRAPAGVDFDDRSRVASFAQRIWERAADDNATMPPAGGVPPEERALLGEWLACGTP